MPNFSAPPLMLLAEKVPFAALKSSNITVSISVGPDPRFSFGGVGGSLKRSFFAKIATGSGPSVSCTGDSGDC
ncbi:hypothetical protein ABIF00_000449 [Bradyrhizobium elkanii]